MTHDEIDGLAEQLVNGPLYPSDVKRVAAILRAITAAERSAAMEKAAKIAEGPKLYPWGVGPLLFRGTEQHHWSLASDYGRARTDAANEIRAALSPPAQAGAPGPMRVPIDMDTHDMQDPPHAPTTGGDA